MSKRRRNKQPISRLQEALNKLAQDPAWKHKVIILPPGKRAG